MTELLTTQEAAKRLDVMPCALMVWRCTKRYPLKFIRIGRKFLYRAVDIETFLNPEP